MNATKSRVTFGLLVACLLIAGGCKTEQPGVTNRIGTIKATLAASPAAVTEAANEVLGDMDLVIINASSTSIDGRVIARTAQDVKVRVDSEKVGENVSEVFIRVGRLGDPDLSLTILDKIKGELGIATSKEVDADDTADHDDKADDDAGNEQDNDNDGK